MVHFAKEKGYNVESLKFAEFMEFIEFIEFVELEWRRLRDLKI
jgi:hypothetical protein